MTEYYKISKDTLDDIADTIREMNPNAPQEMSGDEFATYIRGIVDSSLTSMLNNALSTINCDATSVHQYAFYQKSNLTSVTFNNATTLGDYAFGSCSSLKTIKFKSLVGGVGSRAFSYCTSLEKVFLPKWTGYGSYIFDGSSTNIELYCPSVTSFYSYCFYGRSPKKIYLGTTIPSNKGNLSTSCLVYVPRGMLADYQASSVWSSYTIDEYDITITIEDTEYNTYVATWSDWLNTEDNTLGLVALGNNIVDSDGKYLMNGTSFVNPTDYITNNNYTLEEVA